MKKLTRFVPLLTMFKSAIIPTFGSDVKNFFFTYESVSHSSAERICLKYNAVPYYVSFDPTPEFAKCTCTHQYPVLIRGESSHCEAKRITNVTFIDADKFSLSTNLPKSYSSNGTSCGGLLTIKSTQYLNCIYSTSEDTENLNLILSIISTKKNILGISMLEFEPLLITFDSLALM